MHMGRGLVELCLMHKSCFLILTVGVDTAAGLSTCICTGILLCTAVLQCVVLNRYCQYQLSQW